MDAPSCRFGLVGRTLGHSWSPLIHSQLGSVPYDLIELEPDALEPFLRGGAWTGLNVTIPYKVEAARIADECTERVARTGAANALLRRPDGTILADNTDVAGFAWMLERFCAAHLGKTPRGLLVGQEALILGTGGASRAVKAALEDAGARVSCISRNGEDTYVTILSRHPEASLVVNTTPVGMYPHCPASPLPTETLAGLHRLAGVLDIVYNPMRTGICLDAEELGVPCESGLSMLVAQAFFASELFQGTQLDPGLCEHILAGLRAQTENIVLIGMPGSGKTTTGKQLAHLLHRPFIDMDDAFEMEYGRTPAETIQTLGEACFRDEESALLAKTASRSGLVISCGGGVVERAENYRLLHQNACIAMLDRDLSSLSTKGRPLSQSLGVEALAERRLPLYRAWADIVLPCTGTPRGDAKTLIALMGRE